MLLQEGQELVYLKKDKRTGDYQPLFRYTPATEFTASVGYNVRIYQPLVNVGEPLIFFDTQGDFTETRTSVVLEVLVDREQNMISYKTKSGSEYGIQGINVDLPRVRRAGSRHRLNRVRKDGTLPPFPFPPKNIVKATLDRLVDLFWR